MPSTDSCTRLFNEAVRQRWGAPLCVKCGEGEREADPIEVSHFFNVRKSGTRFEPDNVDPLHRYCHTGSVGTSWEYQKHEGGEYREYMARKLGEDGLARLGALSSRHLPLEEAKARFVERLRGGTLWTPSSG